MRRSHVISLLVAVLVAVGSLAGVLLAGWAPVLGVQLQGGVEVVLRPTGEVEDDQLDRAIEIIRSRVDALGVAEPDITRQGSQVVIQLPGVKDKQRAVDLVGQTAELRFRPVLSSFALTDTNAFARTTESVRMFNEQLADFRAEQAVGDDGGADDGAADGGATDGDTSTGDAETSEPAAEEPTAEGPTVEEPAAEEPAAEEPAVEEPAAESGETAEEPAAEDTDTSSDESDTDTGESGTETDGDAAETDTSDPADGTETDGTETDATDTADTTDETGATDETDATDTAVTAVEDLPPPELTPAELDIAENAVLLAGADNFLGYALGPALLTGEVVDDAVATFQNSWVVNINFTPEGSDQFDALARNFFEQQIAIVLDGRVESAPTINATEFGGTAVISGSFTSEEAQDLALVLRFGALPVEFVQDDVRTVSATLGEGTLRAGLIAGLIGLILVGIYMVFYYRLLGLVAVSSLAISGAILWSLISWLGESRGLALTLAGITGIVVSIGVQVDSNIVYYERIKEEVRRGRAVSSAADASFPTAFATIVWADLASLIGAGVLYQLTSGTVRGFALYLGIATLIDLVVSYFFMRPLVNFVARKMVSEHPRRLGISVGEIAGAAPAPAAAAGAVGAGTSTTATPGTTTTSTSNKPGAKP